ncbi:MAG: periplasmic heavy metal sensor [Gemmatimonas sp.]
MVGMMSDRPRNGRRWRIALLASVALNLLLAGVIGVWVARPMFRGPAPQPEFGRVIDRMANRLPDSDAAVLRRAYDAHREEIARLGQNVRRTRERVRAALRADPFDAGALAAAMGEMRAARNGVEDAIQSVMREGAAEMSPEGRRTLARGPRGDRERPPERR